MQSLLFVVTEKCSGKSENDNFICFIKLLTKYNLVLENVITQIYNKKTTVALGLKMN